MPPEHKSKKPMEQERDWEKEYWQLAEQLKQLTALNQSLAQQLDDATFENVELRAKDEKRRAKLRERVAQHRERKINDD